jgi:hypothetical protein
MSRDWLHQIKTRDLVLVFIGVFGLLIIVSLFVTKCSSDLERGQIAYQQARQKKQAQEAKRRAIDELNRLEAERRKRQEEERHRMTQLAKLKAHGVRGIPVNAVERDPFRNLGVWLQVHSEPENADVYFDWAYKGKTPIWLSGAEIDGLLLVTKKDHEAWFHHVRPNKNGSLDANLSEKKTYPGTQLLLTVADGSPGKAFPFLRSQLSDYGFTIPEETTAADFRQMELAAGGLSNDAFRAWARTKFTSDVLLRASVRERHRDLGAQSRVLAGSVRVFVDIDFDLYDLTTGEHRVLITATASNFALDQAQGFQKALKVATVDAVQKLQTRLAR